MIDVQVGCCALKCGRYWIGVASGNRYATFRRRTSAQALRDAQALL